MITYVKYPLTEYGFTYFKLKGANKFIQASKINSHNGFIVISSIENKMGFQSKSMQWKQILKFKGGFNIEKCSKQEWQEVGKKWYKENNIKLPRKLKKKIVGKIK